MSVLRTAKTVLEASNVVLLQYEKPADQSTAVQKKRAEYGQVYYDKFAGKPATPAPPPPTAPTTPTGFKLGDVVQFTGGAVYTSSIAHTPAHSRGKSRCKVTQINSNRNPLHLISEDGGGVHGWVGLVDVAKIGQAPAAPFKEYRVKVGKGTTFRTGAGANFPVAGTIAEGGVFTVVEEKNGFGKLKSGAGWLNLANAQRV